jgi:DNA-binding LacI/PurR family transcriptional regulator
MVDNGEGEVSLGSSILDAHVGRAASIPRPFSIKDLARAANVSHSTVSRALRNSPLINPETTARIQRIARESGYRASAVARGLVTRKTRTLGVVVTTIADPFIAEVVSGIEQGANDNGYSVFLADSNADAKRELSVVRSFAERWVDGIIVTASRVGALHIPHLSEMGVPIVMINNQHAGQFTHSVMIENVAASRTATKHLIELGHCRIAYLGDQSGYESDTERFAGYRQGLEQSGLPFLPELVVHGDGKPEAAILAMDRLLKLPDPPTAVFCYNDMSALGALRAIQLAGLRVPQDISLVGFDDLFVASYMQPPLTTLRQPMRRMGMLAIETLLKLMSGSGPADTIRVPAELIVRESTARREPR